MEGNIFDSQQEKDTIDIDSFQGESYYLESDINLSICLKPNFYSVMNSTISNFDTQGRRERSFNPHLCKTLNLKN